MTFEIDDPEVEAYSTLETLLNSLITPRSPWSSDYNLKLERISTLVEALGYPQLAYPTVHVGGTSGKGTVAAMTAALLSAHGKSTGLHLSPFVQCLTESWQIDGRYARPSVILETVKSVLAADTSVDIARVFGKASYFEVKVASAFRFFAEAEVDAAVVEVGLGGALDATNVLGAGVKILTNVTLDHTDVLGSTVEEIATDKVEIFKPDSLIISGVTQRSVREIVKAKVAELGSVLYLLGDNVEVDWMKEQQGGLRIRIPGEDIAVSLPSSWPDYQLQNAALALLAAYLNLGGLDHDRAASALASVELPGRFEVIQQGSRTVVLDGAHNPSKLSSMIQRLHTAYPDRRLVGVVAVKEGKDVAALAAHAARAFDDVVLTTFRAPPWTPVDPEQLAGAFDEAKFGGALEVERDPNVAVDRAFELGSETDLVVVTGSLYLVGNVRGRWHPIAHEINYGQSYRL